MLILLSGSRKGQNDHHQNKEAQQYIPKFFRSRIHFNYYLRVSDATLPALESEINERDFA